MREARPRGRVRGDVVQDRLEADREVVEAGGEAADGGAEGLGGVEGLAAGGGAEGGWEGRGGGSRGGGHPGIRREVPRRGRAVLGEGRRSCFLRCLQNPGGAAAALRRGRRGARLAVGALLEERRLVVRGAVVVVGQLRRGAGRKGVSGVVRGRWWGSARRREVCRAWARARMLRVRSSGQGARVCVRAMRLRICGRGAVRRGDGRSLERRRLGGSRITAVKQRTAAEHGDRGAEALTTWELWERSSLMSRQTLAPSWRKPLRTSERDAAGRKNG